jgi:transcriptional regulator with GAF, ATPase, and Fis domain
VRRRDVVLSTPRPERSRSGDWRPELPPEGWSLSDVERALVLESLRRTGFVQKDACRLLGISRRKLNYMIRRMGITHPSWRRNREPAGSAEGTAGTQDSPPLIPGRRA